MRTLRGRRTAELPPLTNGEDLVALNATVGGRLVAVFEHGDRGDRLRNARLRIHLHDTEHGWHQVPLTGATVTPSLVDLLPGGEFLLVQSRSNSRPHESAQDNAQVFDPSGQPLRSFRLGDGIRHLAVDEPGTIWVGYFDEGAYGGDPLSAAGVTRFDEYGRRLWSYWPPPGFDHIADCHALNVGARTAWVYYYTQFPLVRITDTEARPFYSGSRHLLGEQGVVAVEAGALVESAGAGLVSGSRSASRDARDCRAASRLVSAATLIRECTAGSWSAWLRKRAR